MLMVCYSAYRQPLAASPTMMKALLFCKGHTITGIPRELLAVTAQGGQSSSGKGVHYT